jgi:hypothetical protein
MASQEDNQFRILAFDGGPSTPMLLRLVRDIEITYPGFLARTDMFSGTSDGAFISLYLAHALSLNPKGSVDVIEDCIKFHDEIVFTFRATPVKVVRLASGLLSMNPGGPLRDILEKTFGDARIGDLKKQVSIETFDETSFQARTFTQASARGLPETRLVDAALASSAFPILQPLLEPSRGRLKGHLLTDGALTSNSTAMWALTDALDHLARKEGISREVAENGAGVHHLLSRISILSLGAMAAGADRPETLLKRLLQLPLFPIRLLQREPGDLVQYGWLWLLWHSAVVFMSRIEGASEEDTLLAAHLLGHFRFFRFAPKMNGVRWFTEWILAPRLGLRQSEQLATELWAEQLAAIPPPGGKPWQSLASWVPHCWLQAPPPVPNEVPHPARPEAVAR